MAYQDLTFDVKEHIATITLNRPEALNALSRPMMDSLDLAYQEVNRNNGIRVLVITGAGRGFCSGIDLKLTNMSQVSVERLFLDPGDYWTGKLLRVTKPTIGAVNGVAVGGGMALALACDFRIASDQARFSTRFAQIGMSVLDGMASLLLQAVGLAKTLELLYTSEMLDAQAALKLGIVSYVYPQDQLMAKVTEMARKIAEGPPLAHQLSKYVVLNTVGRNFHDHMPYQLYSTSLNRTLAQHDIQEGVQSFRERRQAKFRGLPPSG